MEIVYVQKLTNKYFANKSFIGLVGEKRDLKILVNDLEKIDININKKVKAIIDETHEFVEFLTLDKTIFKMKISELSIVERRLVSLIKTLTLKPELVVLNNFEVGFNDKCLSEVVRLLKMVNSETGTKFVVISRNPLFLNQVVKDIIVMKNRIIKYQGHIIPAIKQNLLPKPPIISFIDLANQKGANLEYTLDEKELLKSIYRSVK